MYPKIITFYTDNEEIGPGYGEARKDGQGEAWHVMHPGGDFRHHGSVAEIRRVIRTMVPGATFEPSK